jgi:hypothetical protein
VILIQAREVLKNALSLESRDKQQGQFHIRGDSGGERRLEDSASRLRNWKSKTQKRAMIIQFDKCIRNVAAGLA